MNLALPRRSPAPPAPRQPPCPRASSGVEAPTLGEAWPGESGAQGGDGGILGPSRPKKTSLGRTWGGRGERPSGPQGGQRVVPVPAPWPPWPRRAGKHRPRRLDRARREGRGDAVAGASSVFGQPVGDPALGGALRTSSFSFGEPEEDPGGRERPAPGLGAAGQGALSALPA